MTKKDQKFLSLLKQTIKSVVDQYISYPLDDVAMHAMRNEINARVSKVVPSYTERYSIEPYKTNDKKPKIRIKSIRKQ